MGGNYDEAHSILQDGLRILQVKQLPELEKNLGKELEKLENEFRDDIVKLEGLFDVDLGRWK